MRIPRLPFAILTVAILFWGCQPPTDSSSPGTAGTPPSGIPVTGVTLNKSSTSLVVGGTETLTATVAPQAATNQSVTWTSSAPNVASVSSAGLVTAVAVGASTITATTADGSKTAACLVTVSATTVAVTGVTLNKSSTSLVVGGTETLTAVLAPQSATNQNVTWNSSAPNVASVSSSGLVTALAAGSSTITVTTADGSKTATCLVTVAGSVTVSFTPYQTLSFSPSSLVLNNGDTVDISVNAPATAVCTWYDTWGNQITVQDPVSGTWANLTAPTYTYTTPDGVGQFRVSVTVLVGGLLYSGSLNITVNP